MDTFQILLDAPTAAVSRIPIAQLGDFKDGRYGEFSITRDNIENWSRNLAKLPGGRGLIDLDHAADRQPRKTEAAGWITGVGMDGDTPVADVEWTPAGEQAIREKRYLFISPTYGPHKDSQGVVTEDTLVGAALTNKPFLNMPMLQLASDETQNAALALITLDVSQAERDLAVKEKNALPDGTYPIRNKAQLHSAIILASSGHGDVQAAKKLIVRRAGELDATDMLPDEWKPKPRAKRLDSRAAVDIELVKLLDLPEDADDAKILEAVTALKEAKPDPEAEPKTLDQLANDAGMKVLTTAEYAGLKSLETRFNTVEKELAQRTFDAAWDKAIATGRVVPAQRDEKLHFYGLDAEATLKSLDEGPVLVSVRPSGWNNGHLQDGDGAPDGPGNHKLDKLVKDELKTLGKGLDHYDEALQIVLGKIEAGEL